MSSLPIATATSTASFINSLGINTHLDYLGSDYSSLSVVESALAYLGLSNIRDLAPSTYALNEYASLAAAGIKFDLIISNDGTAVNIPTDLVQIEVLEAAVPGSVRSIEGPNEPNAVGTDVTFNGASATNPAVGDAIIRALYQTVQGTSSLAGIPIINLSVSEGDPDWSSFEAGLGNESAYINETNAHIYFGDGVEPAAQILYELSHIETAAPGDPVTITETGYPTAPDDTSGWSGVDQITQAKETLNDLMDAYKDGVSTTYIYELLDEAADPSSSDGGDNFGLFLADGTPKLAATAIHDLTIILADKGADSASFVPGSLDYKLTGLPSDGNNSLLLEKSDGAFDIVVWAEPDIWDPATESDVAAPTTPVTVSLGATYAMVDVFDPLVGTLPVVIYYNVSSVTIGLTDHPLIIEVEPPTVITGTHGMTVPLGAANESVDSSGPDTVIVGSGNALVSGDGPTITIYGGSGGLTYSGTAKATIYGSSGPMLLTLSGTGSTIDGGSGAMAVTDKVGGNTIQGAYTGSPITVETTTGNDLIVTGDWTSTNIIKLGAGNDTVIANGASDITGSTGNDTITVNEWVGYVTTGTGFSSLTFNTEGVLTAHGHDTVTSTAGALTVEALGPTINLTGGSGYISYSGTSAATIIAGSGGGGFNFLQSVSDTLTTAKGASDTVWLGAGPSTITSAGNDAIYAGSGTVSLDAAGLVNDKMMFYGGNGAATLVLGAETVNAAGGAGALTVELGSGNASIEVDTAGAADVFKFIPGMGGGTDLITNFRAAKDMVHYQGVSVVSDSVTGSGLNVVLSNSTHVTYLGITTAVPAILKGT